MNFNRQPFQNSIDTDFFYGGGARREIVDNIKTALVNEVPLITLTGTEGSGKTMICRMVENELAGDLLILLFEHGVESFDEVVDGVAAMAGLKDQTDITDRKARLDKAVELLQKQDRRLVVILDSAEKIFLATLERIRGMLDQVNSDRVSIQLLLSGQPLFSINFKQLAIVSFNEVEEKQFSLDTLDSNDTYLYLVHCLEIAGGQDQDIFTPVMADRVMDVARGNFRLINQLASRYLTSISVAEPTQRKGGDSSPADAGSNEARAQSRISTGLANVDLDFLKVPRIGFRWYAIGAGIIAVILLIILLTGGDDEKTEPVPESAQVPELTLENVELDPIEIPQLSIPPEPIPVPPPKETPKITEPEIEKEKKAPVEVARKQDEVSPPAKPEEEPELLLQTEKEEVVVEEIVTPASKPETTVIAEQLRTEAAAQPEPALSEVSEEQEQQAAVKTPSEQPAKQEDKPLEINEQKQESAAAEETVEVEPEVIAEETVTSELSVAEPEAKPEEESELLLQTEKEEVVVDEIVTPASKPETTVIAEQLRTETAAQPEPALSEVSEEQKPEPEKITEVETVAKVEDPAVPPPPSPPEEQVNQVEKKTVSEPVVVEPGSEEIPALPGLPEQPKEIEKTVQPEPAEIPQLTVATKKKETIESVASTVVTIQEERKKRPQSIVPTLVPQPEPVEREAEQDVVEREVGPPVTEEQADLETADTKPEPIASAPTSSRKKPAQTGKESRVYYAERLAAGSRWLVGSSSSKYTVQLMVLNSYEAERNIREMLSEEGYQPFRDQLYILKRSGQPQTVMLYYGEFDSQAEASQAKSNLPSSLTKLDPYAISVKEAVAKARSGQ